MGIIWPEPREIESEARVRSVSLKRVLRIAGQGETGQRLVLLVRGGGGFKKTYVLRRGGLPGFPS